MNANDTSDNKDDIRVGHVIFSSINLLLKYIMMCYRPKKLRICLVAKSKGVARGGQMGQQPHPGMSLPHLGGAAGQRWGSRFSGQLKKSYKDN